MGQLAPGERQQQDGRKIQSLSTVEDVISDISVIIDHSYQKHVFENKFAKKPLPLKTQEFSGGQSLSRFFFFSVAFLGMNAVA